MSDSILTNFLRIVEEVEALSLEELPNFEGLIEKILSELISEEDVVQIAKVLGESDLEKLKREIQGDALVLLCFVPDLLGSVVKFARTILIFERFLMLDD